LDTKRKIGIVYSFDDSWIAGVYYLNSIVSVLEKHNNLFDIFIIGRTKTDISSNLAFIKLRFNIFDRIINSINRLTKKLFSVVNLYINIFMRKKIDELMALDYIFPAWANNIYFNRLPDSKKIFWIPDFQENYYPHFFLNQEITNRILFQVNAMYSSGKLVLSSQSAYKDLLRIYPKYCCNVAILPFVSSLFFEKAGDVPYSVILDKYNIKENYFICSNQFWVHKNHIVLIEAVSILKKSNVDVKVYFTGREFDYRDPGNTVRLKNRVAELRLEENILFLGFIPRGEQLTFIKYAKAVIQPSLFEGWNTTIEDAKYLQKKIIASDIPVHREQLGNKGIYFDPSSASDLAAEMKNLYNDVTADIDYSYPQAYSEYQKNILELFS
jgi:glycosyltransferase involved in cell wall biosynthesis